MNYKIMLHFPPDTLRLPHTSTCVTPDVIGKKHDPIPHAMTLVALYNNPSWALKLKNIETQLQHLWTKINHVQPHTPLSQTIPTTTTSDLDITPTTPNIGLLSYGVSHLRDLADIHQDATCDFLLEKFIIFENLRKLKIQNPHLMIADLQQIFETRGEKHESYIAQNRVDCTRKIFKDFIFSELDKNTGSSLVCCPLYYFQKLKAAYTDDTDHYLRVDEPETQILERWRLKLLLINPVKTKKKENATYANTRELDSPSHLGQMHNYRKLTYYSKIKISLSTDRLLLISHTRIKHY